MKRTREEAETDIVWQTPANPPELHDYIFRNGRRYVKPYYFEFICHVKKRWAGKTIVDLFAEEFKGRPYDYYVSAVKCGRIQVDGKNVSVSYIVLPSQKISHFVHRHEPPALAGDVSILQKEPDVLTVYKPASVPVHPCGQYRKNTVVGILQAEHGLFPLFPVHRLDRMVSGLLILARTAARADAFRQQIEDGIVHKQYVAKVIGLFPEGEKGDSYGGPALKGKVACTKFTRISTDGTHSVVICEPITGRTHQIRVHLQHMGHPIANDFLYLSNIVVDRSTQGKTAGRAAAVNSNHSPICNVSCNADSDDFEDNSSEEFSIDPMCTNCPNLAPKGYDEHEEGLWLHCVKYSGPGWIYECPCPGWASLS